jgi:hypothetical protein
VEAAVAWWILTGFKALAVWIDCRTMLHGVERQRLHDILLRPPSIPMIEEQAESLPPAGLNLKEILEGFRDRDVVVVLDHCEELSPTLHKEVLTTIEPTHQSLSSQEGVFIAISAEFGHIWGGKSFM